MRALSDGCARILIALIGLYRDYVSPLRPASCRFTPTCSAYAVDALRGHGLLCGAALALRRLLSCGPWHRGGWDPVPECRRAGRSAATSRSDSLV